MSDYGWEDLKAIKDLAVRRLHEFVEGFLVVFVRLANLDLECQEDFVLFLFNLLFEDRDSLFLVRCVCCTS
jgi:hypothetical protein